MQDSVNFICDDPRIKAISFVGSNRAGEYIHDRGTRNGKRVQSNMGAKNHATVLPDADKEATLNALAGAAFGAAGQRCMALSTAIFVGEARNWIKDLKAKAASLKVNEGTKADADLGPLISVEVLSPDLACAPTSDTPLTCVSLSVFCPSVPQPRARADSVGYRPGR